MKQDLAHKFCRKKTNKDISILTGTHTNHDQIHHQVDIRNNWLGPIFFSAVDSHTKGLLVLFHPGLEGITEVDTDPKGGVCVLHGYSTLSNEEVLCVYAPSGYSIREQLARGRFFKRLQNYMENKDEGNESKIILGDFNCSIDKMGRYGGNKTQRLYRCCSNYAFIVDNGLSIYGKGRTQIPLSSPTLKSPLARI